MKAILIALLLLGAALLSADINVYVIGTTVPQWTEVCIKAPGIQYYQYGYVPGVIHFDVDLEEGDLIKACFTLDGHDFWSPRTEYVAPVTNLLISTP